MGRWLRIGTTVLALTATGAVVPAATAAGTPVQVRISTTPKVVFTALTSPYGDPRAHTVVEWSASRPSTMTATVRDGAGAVLSTQTQDVPDSRERFTTFDYLDASGRELPSGSYTLQLDAVDGDGNRDSETFPIPLDRDTVVPLEGVVAGRTYTGNVTVAVGPRPGVTLTKAKFAVEDESDWTCAYTGDIKPGFAGRVQATFSVADCGNADARGRAIFEFTDRLGATQTGFTPEVAFNTADRVAPSAKLSYSPAAETLHLKRQGTFETSRTTYAVRDASQIASATYEIRNGFGIVVASGDLTEIDGPSSDILTHLYELRWNGTRNNGTLLPAARYRVTTRFADAVGYRTTGPAVTIDLDTTVPGTLAVTPIDGYRWQVVVTPKAGAGVTGVAVSTAHPSQYDPQPLTVPYDAATGTYRTILSLAGRPAGSYPVRALITRGTAPTATTFTTPDQQLVLAEDTAGPVVTQPANSRLYLGLPEQYVAATFSFGVTDQSAVQSADFVVSSADGTTLVDHTVAAGGEGRTSFTWDGTGPDGQRLPGGDYVVRTTFTDARGNATPASVTVRLDDTVPGTLAVVATTGNKVTVELTPTPGVTVQAAGVALIWNSCCSAAMERDQTTGRYRATVDLDSRPAGTYHLTSLVARDTPGAAAPYGYYWTAPVTVTVSH